MVQSNEKDTIYDSDWLNGVMDTIKSQNKKSINLMTSGSVPRAYGGNPYLFRPNIPQRVMPRGFTRDVWYRKRIHIPRTADDNPNLKTLLSPERDTKAGSVGTYRYPSPVPFEQNIPANRTNYGFGTAGVMNEYVDSAKQLDPYKKATLKRTSILSEIEVNPTTRRTVREMTYQPVINLQNPNFNKIFGK